MAWDPDSDSGSVFCVFICWSICILLLLILLQKLYRFDVIITHHVVMSWWCTADALTEEDWILHNNEAKEKKFDTILPPTCDRHDRNSVILGKVNSKKKLLWKNCSLCHVVNIVVLTKVVESYVALLALKCCQYWIGTRVRKLVLVKFIKETCKASGWPIAIQLGNSDKVSNNICTFDKLFLKSFLFFIFLCTVW